MKKKYNSMYARTHDEGEKYSSVSKKPAEDHLYENAYVKPDEEKEVISDGVDVTKPEAPKSVALKKYKSLNDVNFRLTPDITRMDNIIGTLKKGLVVEQVDENITDGFMHVVFEKKVGYIKKEFLSEV